jgi:hypothetical protein
MAASVTLLSACLKKGQVDMAKRLVAGYRTVLSVNVRAGDNQTALKGHLLHVSKAKKVTFVRTLQEKRCDGS